MGLFGRRFPYTSFHELNLDWIIEKLQDIEQSAVISVNGKTGEVVLYTDPDVNFPEITSGTWRIARTANGKYIGLQFQNGMLFLLDGETNPRVYTAANPPAFPVTSVNGQTGDVQIAIPTVPVTSVNGQTGDVTIPVPVQSVNGQTGAVTLYQEAGVRLPDVDEGYANIRRQIDSAGTPAIVGLQVDKTKAQRMNGTSRYDIYDAGNPPPYPVQSVNGQTGAVMLAIPFNGPLTNSIWPASSNSTDHNVGFSRGTVDGTVSLFMASDASKVEAYVQFVSSDQQTEYVKKLLTVDDIPSGSGVVSINGLTGVVTLTGSNIPAATGETVTIADVLNDIDDALEQRAYNAVLNGSTWETPAFPLTIYEGQYIAIGRDMYKATADLAAGTALVTSGASANVVPMPSGYLNELDNDIHTVNDNIMKLQEGLAIIVDGDTASVAVPVGGYAYIKNNTHGLTAGLYQNTSGSAFPVSGGTANTSVFTLITNGALNVIPNINYRSGSTEIIFAQSNTGYNPSVASVVFNTPMTDNNYAVILSNALAGGADWNALTFAIRNKTITGFEIYVNDSKIISSPVENLNAICDWIAIQYN